MKFRFTIRTLSQITIVSMKFITKKNLAVFVFVAFVLFLGGCKNIQEYTNQNATSSEYVVDKIDILDTTTVLNTTTSGILSERI